MKIMIISDVHGNLEALLAVLKTGYDKLIFLGDFVDYGPNPDEVIRLIKEQADVIIKGNHDHALAYNTDCGCSYKLKDLSSITREEFTAKAVKEERLEYLRTLSHSKATFIDDFHFFACHAAPEDMYAYLDSGLSDDILTNAFSEVKESFILTGHTHVPYIKEINGKMIINPGSTGQPRDSDTRASFAVIENNEPRIERISYDVYKTIDSIENNMKTVAREHKDRLIQILKTAKV